jgi:hypothetical protein
MRVLEDHHLIDNRFGLAKDYSLTWTAQASEREHVGYLLISWLPASASLPPFELT